VIDYSPCSLPLSQPLMARANATNILRRRVTNFSQEVETTIITIVINIHVTRRRSYCHRTYAVLVVTSKPCHSLYASIPSSPPPHRCWRPLPETTAALEPKFATRTPLTIDTRPPCGDPCDPVYHSVWIEAIFAVVWTDSCIGKPLMWVLPTTAFSGGGGR